MKQVALFGGSFNPPHVGHVKVAAWILESRRADEVWIVPTAHHPFGKSLAPFQDRVDLCRAAFPMKGVRVEEIEASLPPPSFTVRTVEALRAKHPDVAFSLVVGSDVVGEQAKWKDFDRLKTLVTLLPVRRAGAPGSEKDDGTPLFPAVSSTEIRERIVRGEDVSGLVPAAVLSIVEKRRLFLPDGG